MPTCCKTWRASATVKPLPIQQVMKENMNHRVYKSVLDAFYQKYDENPSPKSFNIIHRMVCATPYGYMNAYARKMMVRDRFYAFLFELASFLKLYQNDVGSMKQLLHFIEKKYITMHIMFRGSGVKRIRIEPWRTVIQTSETAFDYGSHTTDISDKLSDILIEYILKGEDINDIVNVQVTTNITSFTKTLDRLINNNVVPKYESDASQSKKD